ncbi:MAG: amidohydrolase family protein [Paraglaciecola sp.]|uniref:amidohydrolase family protein n=1 Tax=Paraglaciecola sp. TaxID=1920173 RepID=UPI003299D6D8
MVQLVKRNKTIHVSLGLAAIILLAACSDAHSPSAPEQQSDHYTMLDYAKLAKIDAHVHANSSDRSFLEQAKLDNFTLLSINVDYPDFPSIAEQRKVALQLKQLDEEQFQFASTFSMDNWQHENWQETVIEDIDLAIKQGAKAVKVWKNIGMSHRDAKGDLVMIDHPSFAPIFEHMKNNNLPLVGHQGEPKNCWLPLEEMTVNNDRQYFAAHPEYHMYLHPEFPSYEDQMQARDTMLVKNPQLRFMGAHMASLEWSVDELAEFFERNPLAVADMAARSGQIQYQSVLDRYKVREFFIKYQDRILYATDLTHNPGRDPEAFKQEVRNKWHQDWKYLSTSEVLQVPEVDGVIKGLALPKSVINKIYRRNAQRFFDLTTH